jgi:hypothetical protein
VFLTICSEFIKANTKASKPLALRGGLFWIALSALVGIEKWAVGKADEIPLSIAASAVVTLIACAFALWINWTEQRRREKLEGHIAAIAAERRATAQVE